jgi:competence ComEA-like helix-hairpin-helix protein
MATQGERRALYFLAAVALLGAGTRACRARRPAAANAVIDEQIAAVDSLGARGPVQRRRVRSTATRNPTPRNPTPVSRVDLDVATAGEIERLPGIGPSLARRIVADRDANGPFRCLAALDRVKGVGPALLTRLDTQATFSLGGGAPCASGARPPESGPPR